MKKFLKSIQLMRKKNDNINVDTFSSEEAISHYSNKMDLTQVEKIIANRYLNIEQKILEVGCGTGRVSNILTKEYKLNVYGTDIVQGMLDTGVANCTLNAEKVFCCDAGETIPVENETFDVVWFTFNGIDFLYPIEKRINFFREANRILKKNGYLIFSSHTKSIYFTMKSKFRLYVLIINLFKAKFRKENYLTAPHKGQGWLIYHIANTKTNIDSVEKHGFKIDDIISKYVSNAMSRLSEVDRIDPFPHYIYRRI